MPFTPDLSNLGGGAATKTVVSAPSTSSTLSAWNTVQEIAASTSGQIYTLPAIAATDIGTDIVLCNTGTENFDIAGTGLTSNIGFTIVPGTSATVTATSTTSSRVVGTNQTQSPASRSLTIRSTAAIAGGAGAWAVAGSGTQFTLPESGTYDLFWSVHYSKSASGGARVRLFDVTNGIPVPFTSQSLGSEASTTFISQSGSARNSSYVPAITPAIIRMEAVINSANAGQDTTDTNVSADIGSAVMGYVKIAGNTSSLGVSSTVQQVAPSFTDTTGQTSIALAGTLTVAKTGIYTISASLIVSLLGTGLGSGTYSFFIGPNSTTNISGTYGGILNTAIGALTDIQSVYIEMQPTTLVAGTVLNIYRTTTLPAGNTLRTVATSLQFLRITEVQSLPVNVRPPKRTTFIASGTWNKDPLSIYTEITLLGGGAGGTNSGASAANIVSIGSSGGNGCYLKVRANASQLSAASYAVTVGAGGGIAAPGGASTVTGIATANGGSTFSTTPLSTLGASGGSAAQPGGNSGPYSVTLGLVVIEALRTNSGTLFFSWVTGGAYSGFLYDGQVPPAISTGTSAFTGFFNGTGAFSRNGVTPSTNTGIGGQGGLSFNGGAAGTASAGTGGYVVITEYYQ